MFRAVSLLLIGGLFGLGLAISGMLNPAKVAGFLDLFGVWDPSLAFVMGGGVIANFIGHRVVMRRRHRFSGPVSGFRPTAGSMAGCCRGQPCSELAGAWAGCAGTGGRLACDGAGRSRSVRADDAGGPCGWSHADQRSGAPSGARGRAALQTRNGTAESP